jgi:AcrR family transcriptional regulator
MSPDIKRPQRADARRSAERLLAAAKQLFAEQGTDASLDEIARRARVGNATLYRHFPTRTDLLVAVYADEVDELCRSGEALLDHTPTDDALLVWLRAFVAHVADKRPLALAVPDDHTGRRSALFDRWHQAMQSTAAALLARAQRAGTIRADIAPADLLALATAIALTSPNAPQAERLLHILRTGLEPPQ